METLDETVKGWLRRALLLAVVVGVLVQAGTSRGDEVAEAFQALRRSEEIAAEGNLSKAYSGYMALIERYPTWWIPNLLAGLILRAMKMPKDQVNRWLERAASFAPDEQAVLFVRATILGEEEVTLEVPPEGAVLPPSDIRMRLSMARAKALEATGKKEEAAREYRKILLRCKNCEAARRRLQGLGKDKGEIY